MTKNTHDADVAFIQALAELLNENDLTELQVKREYGDNDSLNVRVSRKTEGVTQGAASPAPAPPALAAPPPPPRPRPLPRDCPATVPRLLLTLRFLGSPTMGPFRDTFWAHFGGHFVL